MSNVSSAAGCFPTADEAFGPVVDSCRNDFDFTIAFEQYFFTIAPAALLLISAPLRLRYLSKLPFVVAGDLFRITKLSVIAVFAVFQLVLVALWASQSKTFGRVRTVSVAASSVSLVSSLAFCALSYSEHVKSRRPSSILNAYLLVSLIFDGAILRTLWLTALPITIRAIFTTSFALKAILLLLEAKEKKVSPETDEKGRNPEITSGLYSRGVFWWMNPLLKDGFGRLLRPVDLYSLDDQMRTEFLNEKFWHTWNRATSSKTHNLILVCATILKWQLLGVVVPRLCLLAFTICQPLMLNRFLSFLQNPAESVNIGYGLIAAYGLVYLGIALSSSFYRHQSFRTVTMLRGILVSAVFTRSTSLSTVDIDNSAAVTLMSTDVDAIVRAMREVHEFWANIIQIALAAWLLSIRIGFACIGPIIVCVLSLAATMLCSKPSQMYMLAWVEKVQERIGITSTMLGHMKSIKMSGLGPTLTATIANLRVKEIDAAKPFRMMSAVTSGLAQVPVLISPVVAFAFFTITSAKTGEALDATRMFSSLSLIMLLGQPLFWMFETVMDVSAALACFKRIEAFLVKSDRTDNRDVAPGSSQVSIPSQSSSTAQLGPGIELQTFDYSSGAGKEVVSRSTDIVIRNASFSWKEDKPVLNNVNMEVKVGSLTMIVGSVASGKTTLLKGLLGEVPVVTGEISLKRQKSAWCEQSAWLINDTIRNNIIGFSNFDPELYQSVIRCCDLDKDVSRLENGDETVVGSKGITLSGGQKQRVALARAVYSRPQVALFDDIFSGLDNHTAKTVFGRLFDREGGLLRQWGTTIIIATQAVKFLPYADQVTVLKDGRVSEKGTFDELLRSSGYIKDIYQQPTPNDDQETIESISSVEETVKQQGQPKDQGTEAPGDKRRQRGDFTVYRFFFGQVGLWLTVAMLVVEISWAFLENFPTVWLNFWTEANNEHPNQRIGYYLGVYAALQVLAVLAFGLMVMVGLVFVAARAGLQLHQSLLQTVMWAPLSLFNKTDIGSITTRFSQDIGLIDRSLPLALIVSLAVFYLIQKTYLRTSRQLRFLDLEEKAPVYTQFLETLGGLPTIRAFGWGKSALELNHKLVDKSQRPFYLLLMLQQWLTLVLDLVVTGLALLIVGLAVRLRDSVSVGLTGVSLVQLISFAETLKLLIQFWTSLETSIGAVARIKNFREETPDERLPGENHAPPSDWPASGAVEIREISASYGEDLEAKALDGISLSLSAGQKVGICGRTGSGKSSLLLALLRLLDLSSGSMTIDGVDLSTLPREEVRSRLIAITQESFFLPGTIQQNIDPYDAATPEDVASALKKVGLWETIDAKGGLAAKFEEDMLSHGQKQLFSLARAILRKNRGRVVLFDEATSSVDHHTDALMQEIIRAEFRHHTVVSIAHRLETVADFDCVVVLEKGCLVEEGNPQELLISGKGKFKELWDASRHADRSS